METAFARYRAAVARTDELVQPADAGGEDLAASQARAARRLERVRRFLAWTGNPQDAYPVVHVAGTSGKGSTSTAVAAILGAAGYRVGVYTSPYLQVATEKLQLDGRLIGGGDFADLVEEVMQAIERWVAGGEEPLAYAEFWTVLATTWIARSGVDVAVIEVGAGGRLDPTNVVRPAVSVITTVGLDHTATLGGTIPEIAWHKAGIVKPGAPVVTAVTDPEALRVIAAEAAAAGVDLRRVTSEDAAIVVPADPNRGKRPTRAARPETAALRTGLVGGFQASNAATAIAAVRALAEHGFDVPERAMRDGLRRARIPGRFEVIPPRLQRQPRVVLDGAHNPEKAAALAASLPPLMAGGGRLVLVLGTLEGKQATAMAAALLPHAWALVATAPRVVAKPAASAAALAEAARAAGYAGPTAHEDDPTRALERAIELADGAGDTVMVTGSLYLVGNVRERWYPSEAIVRQRTPWPR